MRADLRLTLCMAGCAAAALTASAPASAGGAGVPDTSSGGSQYGAPLPDAVAKRPSVALFRVTPARVVSGRTTPRIALRIVQRGAKKVRARVVFWPVGGRGSVLRLDLGRIATRKTIHPHWPQGQTLAPGRYTVRLHATGPNGGKLLRRANASGRAPLTVTAPPAPKPTTPLAPATPVTEGGVFPIQGPHTYGGRFGDDRGTHSHQGQDLSAAEGLPVLAPLAGTITVRDYQSGGAGFYLVLAAVDGRHFFFAHLQKDTFAVEEGQAVNAGQQLARIGSTGRSSGPHLHFEIWLGGWRASKESRPVDPLAQLLAWDPDH